MARRGENIYKRKDGRWEGRFRNGFKPDGSVKYSSVYGRNYANVKLLLSKMRSEAAGSLTADSDTANDPIPQSLTVQKLFELWLKSIRLTVKESTFAVYRLKCEKHILPVFGSMRYADLTAEKIDEFIAEKISCGLSVKYVRDIFGVMRSVCKFAAKRFSYADRTAFVNLPRVQPKEKHMLNKAEQTALKQYLLSDITPTNAGVLLAMTFGVRIGELCALRWSDIDLEKKIITVRGTVQRVKNFSAGAATKLIVTAPKSRSSAREIPIPDFIFPLLNSIKSAPEHYLLSDSEKIVEPRTMQYRFAAILRKLNISHVSFHSLRHLFATNCIALGADVKTLSELLGHSSVSVTLNLYVHSSMERKMQCIALLDDHMQPI